MPLIAHSTWRAPACTPANELATARPRSSWQCTDSDDVAQLGHALVQAGQERRVLVRHRVADGVGDVDRRRALLDGDRDHLGGEVEVGARGVHRRELDVVDERLGVRDRGARLRQHVLARVLHLVLDVDVRRRDERVDPRSLGVAYRPERRLDVGRLSAREPGDDGPVDLAGDRLDRLEVAGLAIGKPASMTSTPRRASCWAISSFSLAFSEMPGDCSPSRRVVSKICTRSIVSAPSLGRPVSASG